MNRSRLKMARLVMLGTALLAALPLGKSQVDAQAPKPAAAAARDGSHDFDFNFGTWHTSITRVKDPFAVASATIRLEGTVTVRPVWDGRAALEEIEADGPNGHWQALTLFLYNPKSGQWSQTFANSSEGTLASSPLIGGFRDGRGELYSQDSFNGRSILVRGTWSEIERNSHRYEESYSDDGGRTWRRAFLGKLTRLGRIAGEPHADAAAAVPTAQSPREQDGQHDFDFEFGTWRTDLARLRQPLSGSKEWVRYSGTTAVRKVWGGRANLVELEVDGPAGHFQALSLRLYNKAARQWTLNYANSATGMLSMPAPTGSFANGRGEFYNQEMFGDRAVLVRFIISDIRPRSVHFEQAFSPDGGKTWETNWIVTDSRIE